MWHLRTTYNSPLRYEDQAQNGTTTEQNDPPPHANPPDPTPPPENTPPPRHRDPRRSRRHDAVTPRPSAGSAYLYRRQPAPVTQENSESSVCCCKCRQDDESKIFRRLMVTFAVVLVLGTVLLLVGIIYLESAQEHHDNGGSIMPLFGCIMSIVTGACMIGGSILLGKCIITYKWRRNQRDRHAAQANRRTSRNVPDTPEVDPDLPPPYDDVDPLDSSATIFVISGENINVNIAPPALSPPQYTTDLPPQYSPLDPLALDTGSENGYEHDITPYLQTYEVIEIQTLPSLSGVLQDPPAYDDPYPSIERRQNNENPSASESNSRNNNDEVPDTNGISSRLIEEETAC